MEGDQTTESAPRNTAHDTTTQHARLPVEKPPACHDDSDWDVVDEASWESFPASDPPSHSFARKRV